MKVAFTLNGTVAEWEGAPVTRLAAALRKRLEPVGPLRREVLAASSGISVKILESWLDGRAEPNSWQMGRLIVATDAQLWFEIYGPMHEETQRLFDARLAQAQEQAIRERAALSALSGNQELAGKSAVGKKDE